MELQPTSIAFMILALVAIFSALMVITRANPVASVLWLVLNFFALAGFYVLLGAHFLAAVQIIVYAGAIMVLFLFVVMMLNLNRIGTLERSTLVLRTIGALVAGLLLIIVAYAVRSIQMTSNVSIGAMTSMGTAKEIGLSLFNRWMFPFEIIGVMLLAAVVGVVALAKRDSIPFTRRTTGAEQ